MKISKYILGILSIAFLLSLNVYAQDKDKDMTKDQWEAEMGQLKEKKANLTTELTTLKTDVNNLKNTQVGSYDDCINSLYQLVGATKDDIDNFRRAVTDLDGKINRKEGPKADRQKDLNTLKVNKISALPEFFDKVHNQMQSAMDSWTEENLAKSYEVVKGDCLWNIAKKPEHYGNPLAWPSIYHANRDQIKDPNLIYPKQVFKIPNLTEEEKAKYDKLRKNYKPTPVH